MKKFSFFLVLGISIMGFLSISFAQENLTTYTSSAGFSLAFPSGWEVYNSPSNLNPYLMMVGKNS